MVAIDIICNLCAAASCQGPHKTPKEYKDKGKTTALFLLSFRLSPSKSSVV